MQYQKVSELQKITQLADGDLLYIATAAGSSAAIRKDELARILGRANMDEISGDVTLTAADNGKTFEITADAQITVPDWATAPSGWNVELVKDGSADHAVTLATQGSNAVRGGETSLSGQYADGAVLRSDAVSEQFNALGNFAAP